MRYLLPVIDRAYRILDGESISESDARELIRLRYPDATDLYALADRVRLAFGGALAVCSITNAKSGNCSEDCSFCAQSQSNGAAPPTFPMKSDDAIIREAYAMREIGAEAFSIVTSGVGYTAGMREFVRICGVVTRIKKEVGVDVHVSLGTLDDDAVIALREAGVTTVHHNIETAPSYFPRVCTTHSIDERLATARRIKAHGLRLCSGGIIGLGESEDDRVAFAFALRDLHADGIPINMHQKINGTRAPASTLSPREIANTVAVMRLVNPHANIKIVAGRESTVADYQGLLFRAGANGLMVGGYLTTGGRQADDDRRFVAALRADESV